MSIHRRDFLRATAILSAGLVVEHSVYFEKPEVFNHLVLEFLKRNTSVENH